MYEINLLISLKILKNNLKCPARNKLYTHDLEKTYYWGKLGDLWYKFLTLTIIFNCLLLDDYFFYFQLFICLLLNLCYSGFISMTKNVQVKNISSFIFKIRTKMYLWCVHKSNTGDYEIKGSKTPKYINSNSTRHIWDQKRTIQSFINSKTANQHFHFHNMYKTSNVFKHIYELNGI